MTLLQLGQLTSLVDHSAIPKFALDELIAIQDDGLVLYLRALIYRHK